MFNWKRILVVISLAASTALSISVPAMAADSKGWNKEYKRVLNNWRLVDQYSDTSYEQMYFGEDYKLNRYFLCDIDRNGTPELILDSKKMLAYVMTYKNGKMIGLGYYSIDRINRKQKSIVEQGHWHGAGGSGAYEWQVFTLKNGNKMSWTKYIDHMPGEKPNKKYKKIYKKYIKNAKKFSVYKKYRISNKKGLNNIQK